MKALDSVERRRCEGTVAWRRWFSNGDRSENSDYSTGKKRLREDRAPHPLPHQSAWRSPRSVDPRDQDPDRVFFGANRHLSRMRAARSNTVKHRSHRRKSTPRAAGICGWSPIARRLLRAPRATG